MFDEKPESLEPLRLGFMLEEDSICYGCKYYQGEDEDGSDMCDAPEPCT